MMFCGIAARPDRPLHDVKPGLFGEFYERLGARFQFRHRPREAVAVAGRERRAELLLQPFGDQPDEARIVRLADVMGIDAVELGLVEARGAASDIGDVEPLDRVVL